MSDSVVKPGDTIRVISQNEDGSLVVEVVERKVSQVLTGPKWGPKPSKDGQ